MPIKGSDGVLAAAPLAGSSPLVAARTLRIVGLIALAILYAGTAFVPPISGRVVDAVTGEPIEGIAVTLEYTRYHGIGPTTTVAYAQAPTGSSGRFGLKSLVGWSGLLFPAIGEHWLTVNHVHHEFDGSSARLKCRCSTIRGPTSKVHASATLPTSPSRSRTASGCLAA